MDVISPFNHGNVETHHSLSAHVPALAYMNNTLWLSQSKESLNSLLRIADSFYKLNSIQVNWIKSMLLSPFKNQNAIPWYMDLDVEQQTVHSKTSSTRLAHSYPRLTRKSTHR
ncbi:4531_t:CDS:2 [Funneliformis geosporum]|uniref:4531_t:CDS:1 n=1 Tax=Funneliformis geosporum TaxID=1117311 RepID=A0A9W4SLN7_9GLOM|nr:4531_t:CDS:2 [Funneliformis geosporum]